MTTLLKPRYLLYTTMALAVAIITGIGTVQASHKSKGMEADAKRILRKMDRHLDLSSQQKKQIQAAINDSIKNVKTHRENRRQTMQQLWLKDSLSAEEVVEALNKREQQKEDKRQLMAQMVAKLHGILTSEQRQKLASNDHLVSFLSIHTRHHHHKQHKRHHNDYDDHDDHDDHHDDDNH